MELKLQGVSPGAKFNINSKEEEQTKYLCTFYSPHANKSGEYTHRVERRVIGSWIPALKWESLELE